MIQLIFGFLKITVDLKIDFAMLHKKCFERAKPFRHFLLGLTN